MVGWHNIEAHPRDAANDGIIVNGEKIEGSGYSIYIRTWGAMRYRQL